MLALVHNDVSYLKEIVQKLQNILDSIQVPYELLNEKDITKIFEVFCQRNKKSFDILEKGPEISDISIDETSNEICIIFDTAWMPPIEFYEYLVQDEWNVNALYHEPGMQFCGSFTNDKGDKLYEYDNDDKTTIEVIPQDILDFTCLLDDDSDDNSDDDSDDGNEEDDTVNNKEDDNVNNEEDENDKIINLYNKIIDKSDKCYNRVILCTEDIELLNNLEDYINLTQKDLDYQVFNVLFPRPSTEELYDERDDEVDIEEMILDWNERAWGTKCEPKIISYIRNDQKTITILFYTASTPPINLYKFLVDEGWVVTAIYYENNQALYGRFTNTNQNECYDVQEFINSLIV